MTTISDSPIRRAIERMFTSSDGVTRTIDRSKLGQDPSVLREIKKQAEELKTRNAYLKKVGADLQKPTKHEDHSISLPNITSLDVETAKKIKGMISADAASNSNQKRTVYGHFGDQEVTSLPEYISLITAYIEEKSTPKVETDIATPSSQSTSSSSTSSETTTSPAADGAPDWKDSTGTPDRNDILFPNVTSLTRETAAAVYQQVSSLGKQRDFSDSAIHPRNGSTQTHSVETYMAWLAQRAATDVLA